MTACIMLRVLLVGPQHTIPEKNILQVEMVKQTCPTKSCLSDQQIRWSYSEGHKFGVARHGRDCKMLFIEPIAHVLLGEQS